MIYKEIYNVQGLVDAHKQQKENLESWSRASWKRKITSDRQLIHHASTVPLYLHGKVQYVYAPESEHTGSGVVRRATQRVRTMKQVVCTNKHTFTDKFESKKLI